MNWPTWPPSTYFRNLLVATLENNFEDTVADNETRGRCADNTYLLPRERCADNTYLLPHLRTIEDTVADTRQEKDALIIMAAE